MCTRYGMGGVTWSRDPGGESEGEQSMLRSTRSSPAMVSSSGPPSSGAFNSRGQRIVPSVPSESPVKAYLRVRPAAGAERRAGRLHTTR